MDIEMFCKLTQVRIWIERCLEQQESCGGEDMYARLAHDVLCDLLENDIERFGGNPKKYIHSFEVSIVN